VAQTFIQRLAREIKDKRNENTAGLCVVFPNRRPALFLQKELGELYRKPLWLPSVFSIVDFFNQLHDLAVPEPIMLQFELYEVYRQTMGDKAQDFVQFMDWAPTLIQDFNELDAYLVSPDEIFDNLAEFKYFSIWDPGHVELSEFERNYLQFYQSLKVLYTKFKEHLLERSYAYQGLANRMVIENPDRYASQIQWTEIWFAGFNALNKSESKLIEMLQDRVEVKVYWDSDKYYMDDSRQEAGYFLRQHRFREKKEFNWISDSFSDQNRQDHIIGAPGNVSQVKMAAEIIRKIAMETPHLIEKTALILNDESLAPVVLNSIPSELRHFNITMGFSLQQTPFYNFLMSLFEMQENMLRHSRKKRFVYYIKDILRILQSPVIMEYCARHNKEKQRTGLVQSLMKRNLILYSRQNLEKYILHNLPGLRVFFAPWGNPAGEAVQKLLEVLKQLLKNTDLQNGMNAEFINKFIHILVRLKDLMDEYPVEPDLKSLKKYFIRICHNVRIPFSGEPVRGLQIMGLLESRLLDFENLIMLSVNEKIIPKKNQESSFFLHEIRKHFGLPVYANNTAIYAYHFFRALQGAKNTYLIYNTQVDDFGSSEKSRFLLQLKHELPAYNNLPVHESILHPEVHENRQETGISISKTQEMIRQLQTMAKRGFSATALSIFMNCPLQFYFQYIAHIQEEDEIEETIEARTFGLVIHSVFEDLFNPLIGKVLIDEDYKEMLRKYRGLVQKYYDKYYQDGDVKTGKNRLIFEQTLLYVKKLIEAERKMIATKELIVLGTEVDFEVSFPSVISDSEIRLRGQIDRIDKYDNVHRIIDYKTGRVEPKDLRVDEIEDLASGNFSKAFQTLFYAYAYSLQNTLRHPLSMGIISFRNIQEEVVIPFQLRGEGKDISSVFDFAPEIKPAFEKVLTELLEALMNPLNPFEQTEDTKHCTFCNYRNICMR
jgi:CRISPR/Cas system-associated exonuclease Cas4 (RecB family)